MGIITKEGYSQENLRIVKKILEKELSSRLVSFENLSTGYSGFVYKVTTDLPDKKELIIKITPLEKESFFDDETADERVYTTRQSNLYPAYELLKKYGIKTFDLFAYSLPTE